jgi:hypothetical protein
MAEKQGTRWRYAATLCTGDDGCALTARRRPHLLCAGGTLESQKMAQPAAIKVVAPGGARGHRAVAAGDKHMMRHPLGETLA